MTELWDIYDKDRVRQEGFLVRGEPIPKGCFHLVIHVCLFNAEGKMLIQKRQPFKKGFSGLWDVTVGGSAVRGDSASRAAHRELLEEVGIDYDFSHSLPHLSITFRDGFDDIYLIEKEVDISTLRLQYEEVERVKWADAEEILAMIDEGSFIPYHKEFISLLFAMRHRHSAHRTSAS